MESRRIRRRTGSPIGGPHRHPLHHFHAQIARPRRFCRRSHNSTSRGADADDHAESRQHRKSKSARRGRRVGDARDDHRRAHSAPRDARHAGTDQEVARADARSAAARDPRREHPRRSVLHDGSDRPADEDARRDEQQGARARRRRAGSRSVLHDDAVVQDSALVDRARRSRARRRVEHLGQSRRRRRDQHRHEEADRQQRHARPESPVDEHDERGAVEELCRGQLARHSRIGRSAQYRRLSDDARCVSLDRAGQGRVVGEERQRADRRVLHPGDRIQRAMRAAAIISRTKTSAAISSARICRRAPTAPPVSRTTSPIA